MTAKPLPSIESLSLVLSYNPDTGALTWIEGIGGKSRCGMSVSSREVQGYFRVKIQGRTFKAHRVAWMLHYGHPPTDEVDHINGDRGDNRIVNLRLANHCQNASNTKLQCNSTSGHKGVYYVPKKRKWRATVISKGIIYRLGYFASRDAAGIAAAEKRSILDGDFYRDLTLR